MGRRAFRVAMARLMTRTGMDKQGAYQEIKRSFDRGRANYSAARDAGYNPGVYRRNRNNGYW